MDPSTRANLLLFGGAMLVLIAFWLILAGLTGGGVFQVLVGVVAAAGAVYLFRTFAASKR